jgi:hypothetical protein
LLSAELASPDLLALAMDAAESDYLRVSSIRELSMRGDLEGLAPLKRARSETVAAATWLGVGDARPALDVALSGIAVTRPLERAAIFQSLQGEMDDGMTAHAVRREDDANALRILSRASAYGSVVVYLVDHASGYPRQDEDVFFIYTDGTFDIARSDSQGLVVSRRDDVRAIFVR